MNQQQINVNDANQQQKQENPFQEEAPKTPIATPSKRKVSKDISSKDDAKQSNAASKSM